MCNGPAKPAQKLLTPDTPAAPQCQITQYNLVFKQYLVTPEVMSFPIFASSYYEAKELANILAIRNNWIAYIIMEEFV